MTELEIAEEQEQDALQQPWQQEREAAVLAAVDLEQERYKERRMLEADWVADTQLQLSQLSYLDSDHEHKHLALSLSENQPYKADLSDSNSLQEAEGSQARPLEVSSDSEPYDEPRRSGRVTKPTRDLESQQEQVQLGLIPAPGAKARARALNAKKKKNAEVSQLDNEFKLVE